MRRIATICIAAFGMSTAAQAAQLDITLGNDSLRAEYLTPMGEKVADNVATLDFGFLYSEEDDVDRTLAHAGLLIYGDTGARKANVQAGLGARLVLLDADPSISGAAIALGGMVNGQIPQVSRLGGRAWLFYAPDVSSFDDLDGFMEYGASLDYQLIRQAYLMAGYRKLRGDFGRSKGDVESSGFLGLRLLF